MKKYIVVFIISTLIGIACILYPFLGSLITSAKQQMVVDDYNKQLQKISSSDIKNKKKIAQDYNNKLKIITESSTEASTINENTIEDYYNALSVNNDDIIGYIKIPKIDVISPIYSEATDEQLQKGIGHIKSTSLPVGGIGTHCVLSGHTGLVGNRLFTDLDKLEVEDMFYLHTLDDTLAYKINQIKVVLPDETKEYINPQSDKDYCTLITCTPYGVNSHRLLVRGERTEIVEKATTQSTNFEVSQTKKFPVALIIILFIPIVIFLIMRLKNSKLKKLK